jgi:hypothetical protein
MSRPSLEQVLAAPSFVVGADGRPTAVVIDLVTWQAIVAYLEDEQDGEIMHEAAEDMVSLARGEHPAGWKTWGAFEAELDALEQADELPS